MSSTYCSVDREQNKLGIGGISEVIEERKGMSNIGKEGQLAQSVLMYLSNSQNYMYHKRHKTVRGIWI